MVTHPLLERLFRRIVALRLPIVAAYAVLLPLAVVLALRIPSEGAIDKLIVPSDPDYLATRAFQKVFPEGQVVMLLLEADDPWGPEVLADLSRVEERLRAVPGVVPISGLDIFRRTRPGFQPTAESAEAYRRFANGTSIFRRQGLVGPGFQGIAVGFASKSARERTATLEAIDRALSGAATGPVKEVRRVGAPYVEAWIEHESGAASVRYFPLFGLFVVVVTLFLYRSVRTLFAILLALGTSVALGVGAGSLLGLSFTVVSALVPLTVLVTTLATLVYLQSRFVDQPEESEVDRHQVFALANKFLPVTASTVAAVLGFGALQVSKIRPVREMGLWTATGLAIGWVVAFTLFPALQKLLRTPTSRSVALRIGFYDRLASFLPEFSYRFRWPLVAGSLALSAVGAVALFGIPGHLDHMKVGVDSLDYVDPGLAIHRDMLFFRKNVSGLSVARAWVRTPPGAVVEPEVLRGLDRFATAVEALPGVSSVVGPTTFLRMRRYLAGQGDELPQDPQAFAQAAADVEQLLLSEGELRAFVDVGTLANAQLTVVFSGGDEKDYLRLSQEMRRVWDRTVAGDAAFRGVEMQVVGESMLQAKVGASLVPTLTESFALTAALIFVAFLFVFRSPSARLMAMIPSVFAILLTFLGMRVFGASLNVATILIATTVLGTTENDQIHFFYHLQEGRAQHRDFESALRYALRVSGRAIVFATLINAVGFLALSVSNFPPLRQFGIITAAAFLLGMTADFTALPAALWIVSGERPASLGGAGR
ncbi:MAG TPA: MMPL family transporter [Anaeromyxobacteraceae bacterium]|nr:MMPL family transporter [Anaeromyxobacteraceae bacterium]